MTELMARVVTAVVAAGILTGCAVRQPVTPNLTQDQVRTRTGQDVRPLDQKPDGSLPPGVDLTGGVTEEAAVAVALWNNGQLAADLAALGLARANLLEAGLLRNPSLQLLFPVGAKPFELALTYPLEQFWQRPRRVAAARAQWEQVAQGLVQNGLNTARDARQAHAALLQAGQRVRIARESSDLQSGIAKITQARLRAGDIGGAEAAVSQVDAAKAAEQLKTYEHDVAIAGERLRFVMGLPAGSRLQASPSTLPPSSLPAVDELREKAWADRPDLRAIEMSINAAAQRAKWEKSRLYALGAILSSKESSANGILTGPGVTADIPVFRTTAGAVARADAEVEQAARQYIAQRQRVDLEVSQSRETLVQAQESLAEWRGRVLPPLAVAVDAAKRSYEAGDVSYLFVLETTRQMADARLREADLEAMVRHARAELDRSVGTRLMQGSKP